MLQRLQQFFNNNATAAGAATAKPAAGSPLFGTTGIKIISKEYISNISDKETILETVKIIDQKVADIFDTVNKNTRVFERMERIESVMQQKIEMIRNQASTPDPSAAASAGSSQNPLERFAHFVRGVPRAPATHEATSRSESPSSQVQLRSQESARGGDSIRSVQGTRNLPDAPRAPAAGTSTLIPIAPFTPTQAPIRNRGRGEDCSHRIQELNARCDQNMDDVLQGRKRVAADANSTNTAKMEQAVSATKAWKEAEVTTLRGEYGAALRETSSKRSELGSFRSELHSRFIALGGTQEKWNELANPIMVD